MGDTVDTDNTAQTLSDITATLADGKTQANSAYNPENHDRMKHVERRHFFVRDMVEAAEIIVPFVRSEENISDFLTKPFNKGRGQHFHSLRRAIMSEKEVEEG